MMDQLKNYYKEMGVDEKVFDYVQEVEKGLKDRFETLDAIAQLNQIKVLNAMQKHQIAEMHLGGTTGYGYNDSGREAVEALYADVFGTEDALVRPQITCGTHALGLALSANLRPGDEILAISGKPYDTLEEVIGIRESKGSLKEYGITYAQVDQIASSTDVSTDRCKSSTRILDQGTYDHISSNFRWFFFFDKFTITIINHYDQVFIDLFYKCDCFPDHINR